MKNDMKNGNGKKKDVPKKEDPTKFNGRNLPPDTKIAGEGLENISGWYVHTKPGPNVTEALVEFSDSKGDVKERVLLKVGESKTVELGSMSYTVTIMSHTVTSLDSPDPISSTDVKIVPSNDA